MLVFVAGPLTSHSSQQIRRFPGFSLSFGVGKRTEQKFQPSRNCQQFMNKQFDEVCVSHIVLDRIPSKRNCDFSFLSKLKLFLLIYVW